MNTLITMKDNLTFKLYYPEDICANLTLITYQYSRHVEYNINRIICSFSGESGLASYLSGKLKDLLSDDIEILFISNENITTEVTIKEQADLIVCNYVLSDTTIEIPIFRMPYVPSEKDWLSLCEYIKRL
ncbi:MAG: hypothetical protein ACK5LL_04120 [Suipraeoptans sp.]